MSEITLFKRFKTNMLYAILAQGVSFVFSVLMSLLVPRYLGLEQYAYWQLFIFYSTYVGLLHFGLSDGVYLKHGGEEIDELNRGMIGSQFKVMIIWQVIVSIGILAFVTRLTDSKERQLVWVFVTIYLVVANASWYLGYVFQATNKTSVYSISIIISRVLYIMFIMCMILIQTDSFIPYAVFYIITQFASLLYLLHEARDFVLSPMLSTGCVINEIMSNIRIGINLTISNITSSLIVGIGRVFVDRASGIESFGLLSLSIMIVNFFIQFICQISMVLFPALRQITLESIKLVFIKMRLSVSIILCFIFALYFPFKVFLTWWLPQYTESVRLLVFILPICVYDGKMQLLYNTYLKVLRKEKFILFINLISLIISCVLCSIFAFGAKSIAGVAMSMMIAIALRSIIAGVYLSKYIGVEFDEGVLWEICFVLLFVYIGLYAKTINGLLVYLACYSILLLVKWREIKDVILSIKMIHHVQQIRTGKD